MTELDGDPQEKEAGRSLRRSNRKHAQTQRSPKRKALGAEQHSGERRWNPFRTKHVLYSVCEVVTGFSSEQWDKMVEAGWRVKDASILNGAGYVLAPWLNKEINNIRELTSRGQAFGPTTRVSRINLVVPKMSIAGEQVFMMSAEYE